MKDDIVEKMSMADKRELVLSVAEEYANRLPLPELTKRGKIKHIIIALKSIQKIIGDEEGLKDLKDEIERLISEFMNRW